MRVLAVARGHKLPGPEAAEDLTELGQIGWLLEDAERPLGFADPIDDEDLRPTGEDPKGVPIRKHPTALLRDEPELWIPVREWDDGVRELDARERRRRSNFEIEAHQVLRHAHDRELGRLMKSPGASGG